MKKIKFFLAAFAAMFGLGMQAQTWTGNPVAEGSFYLYNVGAQKYLNNGDPLQSWGTNAYLQAGFGMDVAIAQVSEGVYTIDTNVSNGGDSHYLANNLWCDGGATNWTFRAVDGETNTYQIIYNGQYLMANEALNDVEMVGDPGSRTTSTYWKLVTEDDFKSAMVAKEYSSTSPMDVSVFIKGRSFARNDGRNISWTTTHNGGNWTWVGSSENKYYGNEAWGNTFDVHQVIKGLPDGTYEVQCSGFGTNGTTYVYGNTTKGALQTDNSTTYGDNKEDKWKAIHEDNAFAGQSSGTFVLSDGNLTVGIKRENNQGGDWAVWDEFRLYYYGVDLSAFAEILAAAVANAEAVVEGTIPTAAYNALAAVVSEKNTTYTTSAEYTDATNEIIEATNAAKAMQANYSRYKNLRTAALSIASGMNVSDANTEVEAATTTTAIDDAIVTLRAAFLTELPNVTIPKDPGYIDVTDVMVDNASVRQNTEYWTIEGTPDNRYSWAKCDYEECEFYQQNFKFYQTLALTPGTWEFGVTGFHRNGNHSTNFYAGEDKIPIPGVASDVVNSMAGAKTYFDNGNGKVSLKFLIEDPEDVEIGINNQDKETDKWTIFRDFTLKYYGAPDYSVYQAQWNAAVVEANAAITANAIVTGQELTDLNAAISNAPDGNSKKADYLAKINALTDATSAFKAAAPAYDRFVKEQAIAHALSNGITETYPTSAEEALIRFQALKVAEYNYVATAYPYSATSKIGEFTTWERTGTVNGAEKNDFEALTSQHWSGTEKTYYEQPATGYNNSAWTANYTKTTTLPAGSYVIKVAARAATGANTVAKITCSAATLEGPIFNFGDKGKGITTAGVASFDEGEFCNGGNGRGWVWNYLPFTLVEETEVTMTVVAEATSTGQWFSVCDGELLSMNNIATAVAYNETAINAIEDVDVANVTISRNIKADYNTVCLPFDLTSGQVASVFGAGTEVYAFSEESTDANDATINFNKVVAGTISANTPVLVKATAASTEQVFNGVQIVAPTGEAKVAGTNFDFVGTYAPTTVAEGDYFIGSGKLYKSAGSTSMNAFRAYIHATKNVASVRLFIDDVETGIEAINGVEAENGAIYNIAGQRLGKMQKGINIVNGKKIIK